MKNISHDHADHHFDLRHQAIRLANRLWLARGRRLANRFFAAMIARHERHATRIALHRLDDRQLKDTRDDPLADRQPAGRTGADAGADAAAGVALRGVGL